MACRKQVFSSLLLPKQRSWLIRAMFIHTCACCAANNTQAHDSFCDALRPDVLESVTHVSTHIISTYYFVSIRHNFHFLFPFSNCTPQFRFAIRFPLIISFHYYTISTSYSRFPIAGHHSALRLGFHLLFRFTITQFPLLIPVFDFSISISHFSRARNST